MKRKTTKSPCFYLLEIYDFLFSGRIDYQTLTKINDECIDIVYQEIEGTSNNYRRNHNLPSLRCCKYKVKRIKGKLWFYNNEVRRLVYQKIRELENENGNENE